MRTLAQVDAELSAKTRADRPHDGEIRAEIDALLEERHRLSGPLRPSQVLAGQR